MSTQNQIKGENATIIFNSDVIDNINENIKNEISQNIEDNYDEQIKKYINKR